MPLNAWTLIYQTYVNCSKKLTTDINLTDDKSWRYLIVQKQCLYYHGRLFPTGNFKMVTSWSYVGNFNCSFWNINPNISGELALHTTLSWESIIFWSSHYPLQAALIAFACSTGFCLWMSVGRMYYGPDWETPDLVTENCHWLNNTDTTTTASVDTFSQSSMTEADER